MMGSRERYRDMSGNLLWATSRGYLCEENERDNLHHLHSRMKQNRLNLSLSAARIGKKES